MNKLIVIIIVVFLSVAYVAYDFYTADNAQTFNKEKTVDTGFETIHPPEIINSEHADVATVSNDNNIDFRRPRQIEQEADERADEELLKNLGKNFVSLGEILDRPVDTSHMMENLVEDIKRAKYNLKISKKMAAMSKDIYYLDENGERQLNQETLDKIHELRKKLIVQINFDISGQ